jgi:hypothetical protein
MDGPRIIGEGPGMSTPPPPVLVQLIAAIRARHYSRRTEQAYVQWAQRFLRHDGSRPIEEMGAPEVNAFLSHLAVKGRVAAATQSQARAALLFLYRHVLGRPLDIEEGQVAIVRARPSKHLPVVLTRDEVRGLLAPMRSPVMSPFRRHWPASTPEPRGNGGGNGSSRHPASMRRRPPPYRSRATFPAAERPVARSVWAALRRMRNAPTDFVAEWEIAVYRGHGSLTVGAPSLAATRAAQGTPGPGRLV